MPPATPIPPERLAKVDQARQAWIRKLIDLSRRNNLLFFRELKVGTLDLSDADPAVMRALLQSGKTHDDRGISLSKIVPAERQTSFDGSSRRCLRSRTSCTYVSQSCSRVTWDRCR